MTEPRITEEFLDSFFNDFMVKDLLDTVGYRLARIKRFCGESPISVALHSLIVFEITRQQSDKLHQTGGWWFKQYRALLHDAHEAVLSDIPTPVSDKIIPVDYLREAKRTIDEYIRRNSLFGAIDIMPNALEDDAIGIGKDIREADDFARSKEFDWLQENGYHLHEAEYAINTNILIEKLIRYTFPKRKGGLFAGLKDENDGTVAYDWQSPHAIQKLWEHNVRYAAELVSFRMKKDNYEIYRQNAGS